MSAKNHPFYKKWHNYYMYFTILVICILIISKFLGYFPLDARYLIGAIFLLLILLNNYHFIFSKMFFFCPSCKTKVSSNFKSEIDQNTKVKCSSCGVIWDLEIPFRVQRKNNDYHDW